MPDFLHTGKFNDELGMQCPECQTWGFLFQVYKRRIECKLCKAKFTLANRK